MVMLGWWWLALE
jgi:hypothetical protein